MNTCCSNLEFEFVADASHADGCEFTLGKCKNCRADLIHCFQTAIIHAGVYEVIDADLALKIVQLQDKEQKEFMRAWYRSL